VKTRTTKLGHALRELAKTAGDIQGRRCERAAADLDSTALTLGATGARVKTLGAYYTAQGVYRQVAGQPYED
jgi:hypothetical protein